MKYRMNRQNICSHSIRMLFIKQNYITVFYVIFFKKNYFYRFHWSSISVIKNKERERERVKLVNLLSTTHNIMNMHSSPIYYIAVIFIAVLLTNSEAKRKYKRIYFNVWKLTTHSNEERKKRIGQLNWKFASVCAHLQRTIWINSIDVSIIMYDVFEWGAQFFISLLNRVVVYNENSLYIFYNEWP